MKPHPKLTRKGNVCLIITSVNTADNTATVKVTDHSKSTNPGLFDRIFIVSSTVTVMTVRFPVEGAFDLIQHHQVKNIAELEVGDKINAYVFHDEAMKEIIIISAAEERFLRNELERYKQGSRPQKQQPKNRHQKPVQKAATTGGTNEVTSGYNLAQAFTEDGGPRRADVASTEEVTDIRKGRRHNQPAPRRQQQQRPQSGQPQQSQAA